jgi:hypothetical protein
MTPVAMMTLGATFWQFFGSLSVFAVRGRRLVAADRSNLMPDRMGLTHRNTASVTRNLPLGNKGKILRLYALKV